jgi:murein DD-endopeptidase MepM/ murein hydrolase activator NlpD
MEKKINFSKKPTITKIIYGTVIAILCVTAIVIGIVSAANKSDELPPVDNTTETPPSTDNNENPTPAPDTQKKEQTFVSPLVGQVMTEHNLEMPVFSTTLGEWRVHTGIDISCDEGAPVYASCDGTVTKIYSDPLLGYTVELTHENNIVTKYSNLKSEDTSLISVGDTVKSGDRIGTVGDSSISELAEEPHLHFTLTVNGVSVNPLDYISEESKSASLGIS